MGISARLLILSYRETTLVVEQADVLLDESDTELLGCLEDRLVVLAATWSSNVFGSGFGDAIDVIGEGELPRILVQVYRIEKCWEYLRKHHSTQRR